MCVRSFIGTVTLDDLDDLESDSDNTKAVCVYSDLGQIDFNLVNENII